MNAVKTFGVLLFFLLPLWAGSSDLFFMTIENKGAPHAYEDRKGEIKDWYAISLYKNQLTISQCQKKTQSDWIYKSGSLSESIAQIAMKKGKRQKDALALPPNGLFAFKALTDSNQVIHFKEASVQSILDTTIILKNNFERKITFGTQKVTLLAKGQKREDNRLLAGSMTLYAIRNSDTTILMPPEAGALYSKQELLWLGDVNKDGQLDALIKRTSKVGTSTMHFYFCSTHNRYEIDEDYPYQVYSAGIEDYLGILKHDAQQLPLKGVEPFGRKAFSVSNSAFYDSNIELDSLKTPTTLLDKMLILDGEKVRFTYDHTPRYGGKEGAYNVYYGSTATHITVHYQGHSQALMDIGASDGSPTRIQIDKIDNKVAIKIEYMPHYNNIFTMYWIWDTDKQRFRRYMQYHAQGC